MSVDTYNLFISHSWSYGDAYDKFVALLKNRGYFNFNDYSAPKEKPMDAEGVLKLMEAIRNKMRPCQVVIVLAGVYASYSYWIDKEIQIAQEMGKPILAVEPWGAEKTSTKVKNAANEVVKWNADSVVAAIRRLG